MYKASHYGFYEDDDEEEMEIDMVNNYQVDNMNNVNQQTPYAPPPLQPQQQNPFIQQQQQQQQQKPGFFSGLFGGKSVPPPPPQQQYQPYQQPQQPYQPLKPTVVSKTRVKKANTNVLVTDLGSIAKESTIATGDPIFCKHCQSAFSNINQFEDIKLKDGQTQKNIPTAGGLQGNIWKCEFCLTENEVFLVPQEIPSSNIVDYILEQAPMGQTTNNNNNDTKTVEKSKDESMVLFCIDTSGSMECTHQVPPGFKKPSKQMKPNQFDHYQQPNVFGGYHQLPKPQSVSNYITRLECVQIGIQSQLDDMETNHPNRKVGVVSFSEDVTVQGQGDRENTKITGADLNSIAALLEKGTGYEIDQPIVKTKTSIMEKVYAMSGSGSTALGPAITTCIAIASKQPGSKIVLCTDGAANKGLGNLDDKNAEDFYNQMGTIAAKNGTAISVLTIKGTDCRIEYLGKLAEATGGEVNIVDPLKLDSDFKEVLALPVVATNVTIKLVLHQGLYVSDNGQISNSSKIEKSIGSCHAETSYSFEYGIKKGNKLDKELKSLPFQLQIYYTTLTGQKCVRIITNTQEITTNRDEAEDSADLEVLGQNLVQASSNIAATGDYVQSRAKTVQNANILEKIAYKKAQKPTPVNMQPQQQQQIDSAKVWLSQAQKLENTLTTELQKEHSKGQTNNSFKNRKSDRSDETSNVLYNFKSMNSSKAKKF
ncbi:type A von Willebrand factor domain-containing protein [Tieghemostelium lacteum]|uniref:Type A von Willebrand factor domain-containing protein n=1 Tax=Tieghemostelium lacteum TaxID=361077 RepID=A0A151ZBH3_TIELA|nr:type A von Willebrand factor domain-containing protein [Tieghemostelium lacteum]|eukprot:KYQ91296.1 type A von Willebrand factor domain-containing protein [Tieghemostelium lacteum]